MIFGCEAPSVQGGDWAVEGMPRVQAPVLSAAVTGCWNVAPDDASVQKSGQSTSEVKSGLFN